MATLRRHPGLLLILIVGWRPMAAEELLAPDLSLGELFQLADTEGVASLFPESALETAASTAVRRQDDWQRTTADHAWEALEPVPGVALHETVNGFTGISIRGYTLAPTVRGIALLIDGVPVNTLTHGTGFYQAPVIDLAVLDRIDLARGPGSAINGNDAFHGAILLQSRQPAFQGLSTGAEIGEPDHRRAWLSGAWVIDEVWTVSVASAVRSSGDAELDYRFANPGGTPLPGGSWNQDRDSINTVLRVEGHLHEHWTLDVALHDHRSTATDMPMALGSFTGAANNAGHEARLDLATATLTWRPGEDWEAAFGVSGWQGSTTFTSDTTSVPFLAGDRSELESENRRLAATATIKATPHDQVRWFVRAEAAHLEVLDNRTRLFAGQATILDQTNPGADAARTQLSLATETRLRTADHRFELVGGLRYDHLDDIPDELSPRLAAIVHPTPATSLKLLYGHAFRAPFIGELEDSPSLGIAGDPDLESEIIDTLELVAMWRESWWNAGLTLFGSRWDQAIVTDTMMAPPGFIASFTQTGSNEAWGLEGESGVTWNDWSLEGSASYVRSRVTDGPEYRAFPRFQAHARLDWRAPVWDLVVSLANHLALDRDLAPAQRGGDDLRQADDYWRTDLVIRRNWAAGHEVHLTVRNLFDRNLEQPAVFGLFDGVPEPGISIRLGGSWAW